MRKLLSHRAGLCAVDEPLDAGELTDLDALASILARQRPAWEPGTRHAYHGISLGWYEGELIRRVDRERRSLGRFFRDEVADPQGTEFYIGLPSGIPDSRIATTKDLRPVRMLLHLDDMPWAFVRAVMNPRALTARSLTTHGSAAPATSETPASVRWRYPPATASARCAASRKRTARSGS